MPNLEQEAPIEWIRITTKEKQAAKTCLSKTTVALLKEYLFSFPTENPYLFHNNNEGHISDETVNARLRDLAREAEVELGNTNLHWHCFRKMLFSIGKNVSIDGDILKLMLGRSVKKDILTYMTGIDVKSAFTKMQEVLAIKAFTAESENIVQSMESEIKELKQTLIRLQQDSQAYKKANEVLTERLNEYEARLVEHGEVLRMIPTIQKQIAYLKGRIIERKPKIEEKLETTV